MSILQYDDIMISVTILTKNSEKTLRSTLESVASFPEVILLDTGSQDKTLEIAQQFANVRIFIAPFNGFGNAHNLASSHAQHDWILSLDSDEVLSAALVAEIHSLSLDPQVIYSMQRHNYFKGKHIKWCGGWYPDRIIRIYHRKMTRFNEDAVHEKILKNGLKEFELSSPITHTPYLEISDFLNKMQLYSTLYAEQHKQEKKSSLMTAILHGWYAFFKSYILKRGFLGGAEGYIISAYNGHAAFYKYLKLTEKTYTDKKLI